MGEWTAADAEWYAANYGEYPTNRLTIESLELAPDACVVDVGCGTGCALRHAARSVTRGRLIGIDPVARMIEIARERLIAHPAAHRIEIHVAPAHAVPVADGVADVVLALDSYDHWGVHAADGLAEVRRILAPGGRFVLVKDAQVPHVSGDRATFLDALASGGFRIAEERESQTDEATFTTWICLPT